MRRLDRYVGRIMLGAFLAALLFFLFVSILVDLLNNLPRYADRAAQEGLGGLTMAVYLGLYYLKLLPVLFTTVTPFASVIAGMFTVARLQHANEIVPMLFVGRSIRSILRPVLGLGAVAALMMAGCWQWVVPHVGAALATDEAFLREGNSPQKHLVHETHGDVTQYLYVREFDPVQNTLGGVWLLSQSGEPGDVSLTSAPAAVWDANSGDWRLTDGRFRRDRIEVPQAWLNRPDVTPAVLLQQSRDDVDPDTMSYTDLAELLAARPHRADVRLALHRHVTFPLANVLLLLLALPLAVRYERGGRIDRVLGAIGLCAGYVLVDMTCQQLGQRNLLHPIVAAWTPTIVFGSLGVVLFGSTRT